MINVAEYNELVKLLDKAVRFEISPMFYANGYILSPDYRGPGVNYCVEARIRDGKKKWVISHGDRNVYSKSEKDFIYEGLPSSRTDKMRKDTQFHTVEECFSAFKTWKEDKIRELRAEGWKDFVNKK